MWNTTRRKINRVSDYKYSKRLVSTDNGLYIVEKGSPFTVSLMESVTSLTLMDGRIISSIGSSTVGRSNSLDAIPFISSVLESDDETKMKKLLGHLWRIVFAIDSNKITAFFSFNTSHKPLKRVVLSSNSSKEISSEWVADSMYGMPNSSESLTPSRLIKDNACKSWQRLVPLMLANDWTGCETDFWPKSPIGNRFTSMSASLRSHLITNFLLTDSGSKWMRTLSDVLFSSCNHVLKYASVDNSWAKITWLSINVWKSCAFGKYFVAVTGPQDRGSEFDLFGEQMIKILI